MCFLCASSGQETDYVLASYLNLRLSIDIRDEMLMTIRESSEGPQVWQNPTNGTQAPYAIIPAANNAPKS